jgi:tripartite-type tricarboxylate transporter receptor subunit TctC
VRLVVPVSPGGTTDLLARILGEALHKSTGQSFVVDGKPGAAGAIGSVEVARAPADGHTLLVATSRRSPSRACRRSCRSASTRRSPRC